MVLEVVLNGEKVGPEDEEEVGGKGGLFFITGPPNGKNFTTGDGTGNIEVKGGLVDAGSSNRRPTPNWIWIHSGLKSGIPVFVDVEVADNDIRGESTLPSATVFVIAFFISLMITIFIEGKSIGNYFHW